MRNALIALVVILAGSTQFSPVFAGTFQLGAVGGSFQDTNAKGSFGGSDDPVSAYGLEASYLGDWIPLGVRLAYYSGASFPSPKITTVSLLLQKELFSIRPYLGLGVGLADIKKYKYMSTGIAENGQGKFGAYNISAGLDYKIALGIGVGIAYQFVGASIFASENVDNVSPKANLLLFKVFANF